jgi:hypothetical protein
MLSKPAGVRKQHPQMSARCLMRRARRWEHIKAARLIADRACWIVFVESRALRSRHEAREFVSW